MSNGGRSANICAASRKLVAFSPSSPTLASSHADMQGMLACTGARQRCRAWRMQSAACCRAWLSALGMGVGLGQNLALVAPHDAGPCADLVAATAARPRPAPPPRLSHRRSAPSLQAAASSAPAHGGCARTQNTWPACQRSGIAPAARPRPWLHDQVACGAVRGVRGGCAPDAQACMRAKVALPAAPRGGPTALKKIPQALAGSNPAVVDR